MSFKDIIKHLNGVSDKEFTQKMNEYSTLLMRYLVDIENGHHQDDRLFVQHIEKEKRVSDELINQLKTSIRELLDLLNANAGDLGYNKVDVDWCRKKSKRYSWANVGSMSEVITTIQDMKTLIDSKLIKLSKKKVKKVDSQSRIDTLRVMSKSVDNVMGVYLKNAEFDEKAFMIYENNPRQDEPKDRKFYFAPLGDIPYYIDEPEVRKFCLQEWLKEVYTPEMNK